MDRWRGIEGSEESLGRREREKGEGDVKNYIEPVKIISNVNNLAG